MSDMQPLLKLKDIHMPPAAIHWPPAPGWFILILLLILVAGASWIFISKNLPAWHAKRHALQLLKAYQQTYKKEFNSQKTSALINELLKKTALFFYPRTAVASLQGQAWLDFLNKTMQHKASNGAPKDFIRFPRKLATTIKYTKTRNAEESSTLVYEDSCKQSTKDFEFAEKLPKQSIFLAKEILEYPYKNTQNANLDNLFLMTEKWIKSQPNLQKRRRDYV